MKIFLLPIFLFTFSFIFAQNPYIDSLLILLKTNAADTNKATHLNKLCWQHYLIGEYDKGLSYGKQALTLAQSLNFKKGMAASYNNIGTIYSAQGNYPLAFKNFFNSLKLREEIKDKNGIAIAYNNIGSVYQKQDNFTEALKNYQTSLKIKEEINDKQGIAYSYNNIGLMYDIQGNYPLALQNYFAALKITEAINDKKGIATAHNNIGLVYGTLDNFTEALKNFSASLKIEQETDDKEGMAGSYINMVDIYTRLNKIKEAKIYLDKTLQLSIQIGHKELIRDSYTNLTNIDSITGNYKAAFQHYKLFIAYRDSLDNEETKKKSLQSAMQYEFDKKEIAAKAQQDKLDAISAQEKQKQHISLILTTCILILVAVFAVFMYNRFRITTRQKIIIEKQKVLVDKAYEQLHEKNKEVIDSINYASRIQRALITSEKYIASSLNKLMKDK